MRGPLVSLVYRAWSLLFCWMLIYTLLLSAAAAVAAETDRKPVKIAEEPAAIDPATLLPAELARVVTVAVDRVLIDELAERLAKEYDLPVLVNRQHLEQWGYSLGEPITDSLSDEPLYLLLDRLQSLGIGWFRHDDHIELTSADAIQERMELKDFHLGELVDNGFDPDEITEAIVNSIAPDSWDIQGGEGSLILLGDVLFVRQTQRGHREVAGLLAALKQPARRTLTYDAPQNVRLRELLDERVTLSLRNTPLENALARIAELSGAALRIHRASLSGGKVGSRMPVTLEFSGQKLRTVLTAMSRDLRCTWTISDGAIWLISADELDAFSKAAVYDVRDLARDANESSALQQAIENQASPDSWDTAGGSGSLRFARAGVMVVYQPERIHDEVLGLLESYRAALKASKPRRPTGPDPEEVVTRYYRMPTGMAESLRLALPVLLKPETWQSAEAAGAPGTVVILQSRPELLSVAPTRPAADQPRIMLDHSVLVIRQSRAVHDEIPELLSRIEHGDPLIEQTDAVMGGMGGMGFGGGFMQLRDEIPSRR